MDRLMQKAEGLSGWQRLSVVITVLWIGGVTVLAVHWYPSTISLESIAWSQYDDAFRKVDTQIEQHTTSCIRNSAVESPGALNRCINEGRDLRASRNALRDKAAKDIEAQAATFSGRQLHFVLLAIGLAILPPLLLWLAGAWIIRGFTRDS